MRSLAVAAAVAATAASAEVVWRPHPGPQTAFLATPAYEALYGGQAGGGKALSVETPIPTPGGWMLMGDLHPGDVVFADDGAPTEVLACSEVMTGHRCFEVEFSDGEVIVADADHLWVTMTENDRERAHRLTPEWRAARQAKRALRGTGARPDLAESNRAREWKYVPAPVGSPCATLEIARTLRVGPRTNHSIEVAGALKLPDANLPLDPYVLGVWLGDGTSNSGAITSADIEVVQQVAGAGIQIHKRSGKYDWGTYGLASILRGIGVLGNKRIPSAYLRASESQRLAMLQGLMDTDGTSIKSSGAVEFYTTSPALRDGALELIRSMGIKASAGEGIAKIYGREIGPKWRIKFLTETPVFRLSRKLIGQKRAGFRGPHSKRFITDVRPVSSVPVRCIAVTAKSHLYLAGRAMIPTHNSDALLAGALRYVDDPSYHAILFRRTYPQLKRSAIERARVLYQSAFPYADYNEADKLWRFPEGGLVQFSQLEYDSSVNEHQSAEYQFLAFDELTTFTEAQYRYLLSRARSASGLPVYIRAATNPGGIGHAWVKRRWAPWLDKKSPHYGAGPGELRWYVNLPGGERWVERSGRYHADAARCAAEIETRDGRGRGCAAEHHEALSRTFIPAALEDNPTLMRNDPGYLARLMGLDPLTRAWLRFGDWDAAASSGTLFRREMFKVVDAAPAAVSLRVRAWDLAATEPSDSSPDPDWTVGVRLSKKDHIYYVEDVVRVQAGPHVVRGTVGMTAQLDGSGVRISVPQDPGQAGKDQAQDYVVMLSGYDVRTSPETGDKVTRALSVSAQAAAGNILLVRGEWNEAFLQCLESFPSPGAHDDDVDALSRAFAQVNQGGWFLL